MRLPWEESIERAASAAKLDDPTSIRALADEVFRYPQSHRLDPNLGASAKDRLFQAEMAFRQGRGPGVQEQNIVETVNMLATRFGAPDYAKTNAAQVRHFRMALALSEPKFMGTGMVPPGTKVGDSISDTLSPLQAAHLTAAFVEQKQINPRYQVPLEQWKPFALPTRAQPSRAQDYTASVSVNPKLDEMQRVISAGAASLSPQDGQQLLEDVFVSLGVPGEGKLLR